MSKELIYDAATGVTATVKVPDYDDASRTVTEPDGTTRPYTEQENADADACAAYVPEPTLEERLASIEDDFHTIVVTIAKSEGIVP